MNKTIGNTQTTELVATTDAQVNQICGCLMNELRKKTFPSESLGKVLDMQGLEIFSEMVSVIDKYTEMFNKMLIVKVKVDRNKTVDQMIKDSSDVQLLDTAAVKSILQGEGDEVEVFFFPLEKSVNDDMLSKQFELRGLKPVDPYTLAAINETRQHKFPMGTHWKNENGDWVFMVFDNDHVDRRTAGVQMNPTVWVNHWWMAGVRK